MRLCGFALKLSRTGSMEPNIYFTQYNCHDTCQIDSNRVIDPVIQRNGYFGHSENVLNAMLAEAHQGTGPSKDFKDT